MKTAIRSDGRVVRVEEIAPAKVNLILSVGKKRPDGYHEIVSLMETVSLSDKLTFSVEDDLLPGIKLSVSGKYSVPEDSSNLVIRAAEAFFSKIGRRFAVSVQLEKNVPTEAGLGGGSSDAAATIRALNAIAGKPLSEDGLLALAASVGADVAFCLSGGTAICTGIGEKIEQIESPAHRFYAVVKGADRVSTPEAYRALDEIGGRMTDPPVKTDLVELAHGGRIALFNDFERVVFPVCPGIAGIKARLLSLGARDALMSGSGAAVFGLFPDAASAEKAAASFPDADAFAVESVARYAPL